MIVSDEHGWRWSVQNGDPAASACVRLTRLGYQKIILPRVTIMQGIMNGGPTIEDLESDARAYRALEDIIDDDSRESLTAAFLNRMTLYDICKALPDVV